MQHCGLSSLLVLYADADALPQHLVALFVTKSATKTMKRAITRDYDDRNTPDVFDAVYDPYGCDG